MYSFSTLTALISTQTSSSLIEFPKRVFLNSTIFLSRHVFTNERLNILGGYGPLAPSRWRRPWNANDFYSSSPFQRFSGGLSNVRYVGLLERPRADDDDDEREWGRSGGGSSRQTWRPGLRPGAQTARKPGHHGHAAQRHHRT